MAGYQSAMGYLIMYEVVTSILCISPSWDTVLCVCCMYMHREIWNLHSLNLCFYSTYIFLILPIFHKTVVYFPGIHICAFLPNSLIMLSSWAEICHFMSFQPEETLISHSFISPLSSLCIQTILWPLGCGSRVEHSWVFWCLGASDDNGCLHQKSWTSTKTAVVCLSPWYIYHIGSLRPVGHLIIGAMLRDTIKGTLWSTDYDGIFENYFRFLSVVSKLITLAKWYSYHNHNFTSNWYVIFIALQKIQYEFHGGIQKQWEKILKF